MIKNRNSKMTTNSQLSRTDAKNKNKNKLSEQLEQEQNQINGDHMEGYQQGGGGRRMVENMQVVRSIIGRYKIDRERLRIVQEMGKPKNLYVRPMDMNYRGECGWEQRGIKQGKWDMYNSIINKIYLKICDLKGLPKFSNKMCLLKIKRRSKL